MKKITALFAIILLFSCGGEKKETPEKKKDNPVTIVQPPLVIPPVPELDPVFENHTFNADSGANIYIQNSLGTSIRVPAGVMVDSLRQPVSGEVQISYREMHDAASHFAAGIPLDYDAAGMMKRFETAGSFEIHARQDNKTVYVDSGKTITISFGGETERNDFHFFYLDEQVTRNWHYVCDAGGIETGKKKQNTNVLALKIPLGRDYFVLNYMAALDVMLNDKEAEVKKNKNNPDFQKKVKEYGLTWSNMYNYESIEFRGKKYLASMMVWKSLTGTDFPEWAAEATTTLTHKSGYTYQINLKHKSGYEDFFLMEAVMPIKDLFTKKPEEWKSAYDNAVKKLKEEEDTQKALAEVYRTFEINKLGIYTFGKYMKEEGRITVRALFTYDRKTDDKKTDIYYVDETNRTLVKFNYNDRNRFFLYPGKKGKLFALLPENYVVMFDTKDMSAIDYNFLKENSTPEMGFDMEVVKRIDSLQELREILLSN
ncbi:MAG: hypothetical protein ACOZCO_15740 [Bacteroidota bacterium]